MRIKKYENWKLNNSLQSSTFTPARQKNPGIFSISHLLEQPNKSIYSQSEHHFTFTDPQVINHTFVSNPRLPTKKDIQIKRTSQPLDRSEREELIKGKIKERIKEEFSNQIYSNSSASFINQNSAQKQSLQKVLRKSSEPVQGRVYIRGSSVAFNKIEKKKRSKSSFLRTSLPSFSGKSHPSMINQRLQTNKNISYRQLIKSVEIKRKHSSSLGSRQQTDGHFRRKESLKPIQPWEIDEGLQPFQIKIPNQHFFQDRIQELD